MAVAFLGQLLVGVVHAELSSRFAVTGGVCQWVQRSAGLWPGRPVGWICLASTVASPTPVAHLGEGRLYLEINLREGDPLKHFRPHTKLADPAPTPHTEERMAS
ncbi:hypothetical protein [Streptomyces sp. GbtcB6]|uniref:hypothetical protein n=1 Tax=Streptomyces sp. GbtcB6 TaxID=2824751 RepID=UPI001C311B0C|nr:hypothetical protein [Streptomyces sp. GbtcB6]